MGQLEKMGESGVARMNRNFLDETVEGKRKL